MPSSSSRQPKITLGALLFWLVFGGVFGWQLNNTFASEAIIEEDTAETSLLVDLEEELDPTTELEEDIDLELFWDIWDLVDENYYDVDEVTEEERVYGAISGMVDSLEDPYSLFMTPEETDEFQVHLNGELEGIGAELNVKDGRLLIVTPLKGSPAEQEGLLPNDHIYLVDGEPTAEMSMWEAVMNIRGEEGTDVVLTIIREGVDEAFEITITRAEIEVPSVELEVEEHNGVNIAHLYLYQFGDDTHNEFKEALQQMTLMDVEGMVLDMRFNGGGFLDVSVDVLSEFFEDEVKAVIVKQKNEEDSLRYTSGRGNAVDLPLVVLINEGSASASEIVAGALQDHERAPVLGAQSFGKGSVQSLQSLSDGSSVRLTIAKWYTPLDRGIDEVGITPDQLVEMEYEFVDTEDDIQYQAAVETLLDQL